MQSNRVRPIDTMFSPLFAFYVISSEHDEESIQRTLLSTQLDECWLSIEELEISRDDRPLIKIEMFDLHSGTPLNVPDLGELLSSSDKFALLVAAADPKRESAAFEVYEDGETLFSWAGPLASFEKELPSGHTYSAYEGFCDTFAELSGVPWEALLANSTNDSKEQSSPRLVANEHSWLLLRGRFLALPIGMPRYDILFRFHYTSEARLELLPTEEEEEIVLLEDELDIDEDAELDDQDELERIDQGDDLEGADDDQLALVLLDLQVVDHLWREAPAGQAAAFIRALDSVQVSVLGPLAHALPEALAWVNDQNPEEPLANQDSPELLTYEILAMGSSAAYLAGDSVVYYDERFFPLLSLDPVAVSSDAVRASLDDIRSMGILSAMTEVMPYSVPEGELLDCFGDGELSPLADWALSGGMYEGSLFLLDLSRISKLVERFDVDLFQERIDEFTKVWNEFLPPGEQRNNRRQMLLDDTDFALFQWHLEELQMLLSLNKMNHLQPALFFFGS